jgi:regulatory protein
MKPSTSSLTTLDYAYRLLARRAHSEQELAKKLLDKGFTEDAVTRTVATLKVRGYINDATLAADQADRLRARGFGAAGIKEKLARKGLAKGTVDEVVASADGDEDREAARQILASRFPSDALKKPQTYARAFRFLLSRGFSQDVVEDVLGEAPEDGRAPEKEYE